MKKTVVNKLKENIDIIFALIGNFLLFVFSVIILHISYIKIEYRGYNKMESMVTIIIGLAGIVASVVTSAFTINVKLKKDQEIANKIDTRTEDMKPKVDSVFNKTEDMKPKVDNILDYTKESKTILAENVKVNLDKVKEDMKKIDELYDEMKYKKKLDEEYKGKFNKDIFITGIEDIYEENISFKKELTIKELEVNKLNREKDKLLQEKEELMKINRELEEKIKRLEYENSISEDKEFLN